MVKMAKSNTKTRPPVNTKLAASPAANPAAKVAKPVDLTGFITTARCQHKGPITFRGDGPRCSVCDRQLAWVHRDQLRDLELAVLMSRPNPNPGSPGSPGSPVDDGGDGGAVDGD